MSCHFHSLTAIVRPQAARPTGAQARPKLRVEARAIPAVEVAVRNVAGCLAHPVGERGEGAARGAGGDGLSTCIA